MKHLSLNKTFLGVAISAVIASGAYAETVTEGVDLKQFSKKSALETEGEIVVDVESKNPFSAFSRGEKAQSHLVNSDINNTLNFLKEQGLLETNEQKVSIVTGDNTQVKSDLLIRKVFASANCTLPGGACTTISSSSCTLRGGSVGACGSSPEIDVEESGATTVSEDFGSVAADGVATTTKTFTVKNEGTGNLTTTAVSITSGSSDFSITGGTCATNGQTLSSGMQCTILVTVQTTTVGGISGNLRISNTDANESMYNVSLSATGTSTNSAPVVDLNGTMTPGTGSFSAFSEGSGAVNIAPDASAADSDGDTITTITVALTNDQDGTSEGLNASAAAQNALGGISGASDITLQDTISITGASATVAEVTTFLQAITYNNTSATPNTTSRTVSVVINDGTENSISRTATTSVANLTAASSTAAGFSTLDGTNLNPAITFSSDNETLTISNPSHITGSVADGGTGTDTIHVPTGSDLTAFTTLTGFETLSVPSSVTLTLSEAQHEQFTTISGSGAPVFTITAGSGGDANLTANSTIATYVLNTPVSLTLVDRDQSVTGSNLADSVDISNFSYRGTLDGGDGTDTLTLANGASLAAATISNFETLYLSGGVSVTMKEAQHDAFSTISGAGTDQITISATTDGLVAASDIETYVLSTANTITLSNGSQNITGSTGNDTVAVGGLTATGTLNANNGTDTLSMTTGADITGATVSNFANLTLASNSSVNFLASQVGLFTGTVTAPGSETITVSGDGNLTTLSNIETFSIDDDSTNTRTISIGSASQNITANSETDAVTFVAGSLTLTGALTGKGTVNDTLSLSTGANITAATISDIENLTLASGATVSMTRSQQAAFTGTISALGTQTVNITGDGDFSTLFDVETYNVGDDSSNSRTITVSSATQNISDNSSNTSVTFAIGAAGFSGTLFGEPTVADSVSAIDGADVTAGSFFNIGTLSLSSAATVSIDANNISDFGTAITGSAGIDTLKLMDGGTFNFTNTTVSDIEALSLGTNSNTTITLSDNFDTNGATVSFSNASGSAISASVSLDASAFSSDILSITSSNFNGDDTFKGGSGADTLRPGSGTDTLTGNAGNDNFVGSSSQLNGDTITDLAVGDTITVTGVTGLSTANVQFNGTSTLEVDTNATDFNISELTLSLTNAPGNDLAFTVADSGSDTVITFISANSAPVFSALNGGATFIENGTAVVLDSDVTIADTELDALNGSVGNYNNASLTINRSGGASSKDVFGNSGLLGVLTEGELFTYNGNSVGTVTTNSAGTLVLTFNSNASSAVVDAVLQTLTYANNSDDPSSSVSLNYTFSDGVLNSTGTNQATVTITQLDDAPTDISLSATTINQSVTASGADVATISSTDLDDTSHTYTLVAPNTSTSGSCSSNAGNSSFQINGSILETQSAISGGTYIVCVQSDDSTSTFQESFSITVTDDVAPNAPTSLDLIASSDSGSLNTDNYTNDTTPTLSGLAEVGASITLLSDQTGNAVIGTGTATDGTWEITTSELTANVVHTITAKATDALSNVSVASTGIAITLDTVVPSTPSIPDLDTASDTGTSNTDNITTDTTPTLNGTATVGDVITLTSNVDGVLGTVTVPAGGIWSFTPSSAISAGSHTITAYASDLAGNNSTLSALLSITIDAGASTPTITTPIEGDGKVNASEDNDVVISGSGAEAGASVRVSVDGVIGTVTADGSGNWTLAGGNELDISSLNNGTLSINVTQTDTAGNTSSAATSSIILDNQIPSAVAITTPIEIDNKVNAAEDNDVLVQGSGAESSATVTVNIGGITKTATADASGNWSLAGNELDISSLNNGSLSVSATQSDSAGNTSTAATTSITLDNETPNTLTITTPISTDGKVSAAEDDALLITGAGAESGAAVTVNVGGVSTTTTADSSGNWSLSGNELDISALNNGTLTVSATQADSAGNTSTAATTTIVLDNQTPSTLVINTPIEGDGIVNKDEDSDVEITGSGAESGATVSVDIAGVSQNVVANASGNWTLSGRELDISSLNNGTLTVSATQTDSAGNLSDLATKVITLDNVDPTGHSEAITQTEINRSNEAALSFTLSSLEGSGSFTYQITDGSNIVSSSAATTISAVTAEITDVDVTNLNEGTLTLSVAVSDSAGNEADDVTTSVIKRYNIKPVLSGSPITSIDEDAEYSFTPTLTDPDTADTQTFSITNKPSWATFDTATGLLSGTPTDQDVGTTTNVSIQVSDGTEDSDPLTFNIEVIPMMRLLVNTLGLA